MLTITLELTEEEAERLSLLSYHRDAVTDLKEAWIRESLGAKIRAALAAEMDEAVYVPTHYEIGGEAGGA